MYRGATEKLSLEEVLLITGWIANFSTKLWSPFLNEPFKIAEQTFFTLKGMTSGRKRYFIDTGRKMTFSSHNEHLIDRNSKRIVEISGKVDFFPPKKKLIWYRYKWPKSGLLSLRYSQILQKVGKPLKRTKLLLFCHSCRHSWTKKCSGKCVPGVFWSELWFMTEPHKIFKGNQLFLKAWSIL